MRVCVVTHVLDEPARGNMTTIRRWMAHLDGVTLQPVPARADLALDPPPDIVHGYHALHAGAAARALAARYGRPLVVSLGGTDLFALLDGAEGAEDIAGVLGAASVVTGAFDAFGAMLAPHLGGCTRYVTVPRGIDPPAAPRPKRPDGRLDVFVPSGFRPVKDPLLALDLAAALRDRGLALRLRLAGPRLDDAYAERVLRRADALDGVTVGQVAPEGMPEAYACADVVWNTSLREGGANVLLEALAHGCALLVRDVPGNREFFADGAAVARLFDPADLAGIEAFHRALLAEDDAARMERAARARTWIACHHDPATEARALARVYRDAAAGSDRTNAP